MIRVAPLILLAALACSSATAAPAAVPSPEDHISLPTHIRLVGQSAAGADTANGLFFVRVLDIAGNAWAGDTVSIEFSTCTDLRFGTSQPFPGLTVDCPSNAVRALTDVTGRAWFTIVGAGLGTKGTPGPCLVNIYATWWTPHQLLGRVPASAFDLNGSNGVRLNDLGLVYSDYFAATNPGRSDYNGDGIVSLADIGLWWSVFFANTSPNSPAGLCP